MKGLDRHRVFVVQLTTMGIVDTPFVDQEVDALRPRIADNVRRIRISMGMPQVNLAIDSGIHPSSISDIELGKQGIGLITLVRLLIAFNMNYKGPLGAITLDDICFTDSLDIRRKRKKR